MQCYCDQLDYYIKHEQKVFQGENCQGGVREASKKIFAVSRQEQECLGVCGREEKGSVSKSVVKILPVDPMEFEL